MIQIDKVCIRTYIHSICTPVCGVKSLSFLYKIKDEEAAFTGLFSDTDIVDAPGRVEPADTARDQTGTVCSVEINILLDQRGEHSTDIYTYLHISRYIYSISTGPGQQWHGPGLETLFDIQLRHGAACSQEVVGGTQEILIRGSPGYQDLLAIYRITTLSL